MLDHSKSQVFHFAHPVFIELALSYIAYVCMSEWIYMCMYMHTVIYNNKKNLVHSVFRPEIYPYRHYYTLISWALRSNTAKA